MEMAQLYGQISMFDQLTDEMEINDENNLEYKRRRRSLSAHGEDSELEDNGEDSTPNQAFR